MDTQTQDVVIIGGGVSGTALLYMLSCFTDLTSITLLEKYNGVAQVNSNGRHNSQTLHCGDIETNYSLEKALQVNATAQKVVQYANALDDASKIVFKCPKMVLAVGQEECDQLRQRFKRFQPHFPYMELWEADQIAEVEPLVVANRVEPVVAMGTMEQVTTVDFGALSESFVQQAQLVTDKKITLAFNCRVTDIVPDGQQFRIRSNGQEIRARYVVVCAGGHSLWFAQRMGYGLEYSCLPMAGSFYFTPKLLNGKVYTMQNDKLPFAAVHGDPDVLMQGKSRFGPTALVLPLLERYNWKTMPEFLQVLKLDSKVLHVFWDLFKVKDIRNYILRNFLFEVPGIRRRLFLQDARKIVPSLKLEDLTFADGFGGIRPVMIDKNNRKLLLGEAKIAPGNGLVFNMTPSPGATSCLGNAEKDMRMIADYLACRIDEKRLSALFTTP